MIVGGQSHAPIALSVETGLLERAQSRSGRIGNGRAAEPFVKVQHIFDNFILVRVIYRPSIMKSELKLTFSIG